MLGRGTGLAAVLVGNTLELYDTNEGWARASSPPVRLYSAQLAMLDDGSVIAVGGPEGDETCSDEVWRWVP